MLLIAVNTIGTYVEAVIRRDDLMTRKCKEVFSGIWYPLVKDALQAKFKPYEAKVFLFPGTNSEG